MVTPSCHDLLDCLRGSAVKQLSPPAPRSLYEDEDEDEDDDFEDVLEEASAWPFFFLPCFPFPPLLPPWPFPALCLPFPFHPCLSGAVGASISTKSIMGWSSDIRSRLSSLTLLMLIACFLLQAGLLDFLPSSKPAELSRVRVKPDEPAEPTEPAKAEGRPSAALLLEAAVADKLCPAAGRSWAEPAEPLEATGRPSDAEPMVGVLLDKGLWTTNCSCTEPKEPARAEAAAEPVEAAAKDKQPSARGRSGAELAEPAKAEGRPSASELVEAEMADKLLPVTGGSWTGLAGDSLSADEPAEGLPSACGPAEGLPSACGLCTPKEGKPSAAVPGPNSGNSGPNSSLG